MSTSRIDIFKQMLVSDPINSAILFGLAKEYEKTGQTEQMIETLERYLAIADDEGSRTGIPARLAGNDAQEWQPCVDAGASANHNERYQSSKTSKKDEG